MGNLTRNTLAALIRPGEPPCVSIYQPTHRRHPENLQDPIRFKNLVRTVEESLAQRYGDKDARPLLEPLQQLAADGAFWNHTLDGLAILVRRGSADIFRLQRPVKEFAVVADSFHVKPLIRFVQSADRYQVLCLTQESASVLEGNRDALDEPGVEGFPATLKAALGDELTEPERAMHTAGGAGIQHGQGSRKDEVDKDTERYFRAVDRATTATFSKPSGLPLVLVALPEHQPVFRAVSRNPALLPIGVMIDPGSLPADRLRDEVWKAVEPHYLARLATLSEEFTTAQAHRRGTADLSDAARAATEGRIATLLIESDRVLPGRLDASTGAIASGTLDDPEVGDMLDDLAETVLRTGGDVVVVPRERMPTPSGLAATFRY